MHRLLLFIAITALTSACSSQLSASPSRIMQPAGALPFPTSNPGDSSSRMLAAVTDTATRIYSFGPSEAAVPIECGGGGQAFGHIDALNGTIATIGKGELLHVMPEDPDEHYDATVGATPVGAILTVITDDGHEGEVCGKDVTFVTPSKPIPAPSGSPAKS